MFLSHNLQLFNYFLKQEVIWYSFQGPSPTLFRFYLNVLFIFFYLLLLTMMLIVLMYSLGLILLRDFC